MAHSLPPFYSISNWCTHYESALVELQLSMICNDYVHQRVLCVKCLELVVYSMNIIHQVIIISMNYTCCRFWIERSNSLSECNWLLELSLTRYWISKLGLQSFTSLSYIWSCVFHSSSNNSPRAFSKEKVIFHNCSKWLIASYGDALLDSAS